MLIDQGDYQAALEVLRAASAAMLVFAATGLTILFQNPRRRRSSLVSVGLGAATPFVLYLAFVSSIFPGIFGR